VVPRPLPVQRGLIPVAETGAFFTSSSSFSRSPREHERLRHYRPAGFGCSTRRESSRSGSQIALPRVRLIRRQCQRVATKREAKNDERLIEAAALAPEEEPTLVRGRSISGSELVDDDEYADVLQLFPPLGTEAGGRVILRGLHDVDADVEAGDCFRLVPLLLLGIPLPFDTPPRPRPRPWVGGLNLSTLLLPTEASSNFSTPSDFSLASSPSTRGSEVRLWSLLLCRVFLWKLFPFAPELRRSPTRFRDPFEALTSTPSSVSHAPSSLLAPLSWSVPSSPS